MRFLANENFPLPSVRRLRTAGYEVASASEDTPGAKDQDILAWAVREKRIILTFDRDYGELIYRLRLPAPLGIVYFRFQPLTPEEAADHLLELLRVANLVLEHSFTVIQRNQVRQRPLSRTNGNGATPPP